MCISSFNFGLTNLQMGTSSASVSAQIADIRRLVEKSGLKFVQHAEGTTLGKLGGKPKEIREPKLIDSTC
jgi:hypothetical protein